MRFKVGDVVVIVRIRNHAQHLVGQEATIELIGPFAPGHIHHDGLRAPDGGDYRILTKCGTFGTVLESQLRPRYDGNEPAKWEDCVWRPSKVSA